MTTDPLAPLLALADVATAVEQARERVDLAHRHRALRRQGGQ
ncbi:oxidoreductase, partial [Micromonospora aurantiaca]